MTALPRNRNDKRGELAGGGLVNQTETLALLSALPPAPQASHDEALTLLDQYALAASGLGWIDVHLLTSTVLGRATL